MGDTDQSYITSLSVFLYGNERADEPNKWSDWQISVKFSLKYMINKPSTFRHHENIEQKFTNAVL